MAKKLPARKAEQHELDEFAEKYEIFSAIYADPVEILFEIMTSISATDDLRASVARDLMSFRFPKLKALETKDGADKTKPIELTINLIHPRPQEIDITPPTLKLVEKSK